MIRQLFQLPLLRYSTQRLSPLKLNIKENPQNANFNENWGDFKQFISRNPGPLIFYNKTSWIIYFPHKGLLIKISLTLDIITVLLHYYGKEP
ncbi:hypothetical protein PEDI_55890 [Persicobacter diffluens]|uniref:Uncharacterized protein n=1 Tax=Persicobacter diffluens TaxID=981 RepID=A0AAN5ANQ4_9BACT|nr:hypothetical protein PEDI_55890 [Persicobacter diffluens]